MIPTTLPRSELASVPAVVAGAGRPLLLLHGVGLRAEAWAAQIKAFCGDYHVIAPDMPGHGHYSLRTQMRTLEDYAQAVLPLLDVLSEPALVVGHSMGAMIALELARVAPERVGAVAALNAIFERSEVAKAAVQARAASFDGKSLPDPMPTLERWFGAQQSTLRTACEGWLRQADPEGYKQAYTIFGHADGPSRPSLEGLDCPSLFATGSLEPNSTPAMSCAMAELAPQGRVLIVDGAAHMMPMTHATEVNAALSALAMEVWH